MNDMPEIVHNMIQMFGNNTKIICQIKDDHDSDQLQNDLKALEEWSNDWFLRFNARKMQSDRSWPTQWPA